MKSKKKTFLRIVFLVLLSFLVILGVYQSRTLVSAYSGKKHIGITYMTMNNDFYRVLSTELEQSIHEKGDAVHIRDAALDVKRQCEQIQYFINQEVDAIMINPVDGDDSQLINLLSKARQKGIAVVVVDSQLKDEKIADTTVISDNYKAGVLNAQKMMKTVDKANILILEHYQARSARDRINGFLDTIEGNDKYKVVERKEALGQTEIAMPVVSNVIEDGIDFDVVVSLNDQVALGALAAIKEKDVNKTIYLYSVDGSPELKSLLSNTGEVQTTVAQSVTGIAQESIDALYKILDEEEVEEEILVPVTLLDKSNINDYDLTRWQ